MFSCFKKSEKVLLCKVYLLAWCLMLNWLQRHAFIYATKTWNPCFFNSFWKVLIKKHVKKIIKVNGNSLRQQKVQVIMYHVIEHFISSLADNKNEPPKNEQYFYFSFCRRYRDFSLTYYNFWSYSWVTAPYSTIVFLVINLYLMTVVMYPKQRVAITPYSNWRCMFVFKACQNIRHETSLKLAYEQM